MEDEDTEGLTRCFCDDDWVDTTCATPCVNGVNVDYYCVCNDNCTTGVSCDETCSGHGAFFLSSSCDYCNDKMCFISQETARTTALVSASSTMDTRVTNVRTTSAQAGQITAWEVVRENVTWQHTYAPANRDSLVSKPRFFPFLIKVLLQFVLEAIF